MKTVYLYMHTIEGRPAQFNGDQIVFANGTHTVEGAYSNRVTVDSLRTSAARIKREQRDSLAWRKEYCGLTDTKEYGYCRIEVRIP